MSFEDFLIGFGVACVFWFTSWIKSNGSGEEVKEEIKEDIVEPKKVVHVVNVAEKYKDSIRYLYGLVTTKTNKDKASRFLTDQGFNV